MRRVCTWVGAVLRGRDAGQKGAQNPSGPIGGSLSSHHAPPAPDALGPTHEGLQDGALLSPGAVWAALQAPHGQGPRARAQEDSEQLCRSRPEAQRRRAKGHWGAEVAAVACSRPSGPEGTDTPQGEGQAPRSC